MSEEHIQPETVAVSPTAIATGTPPTTPATQNAPGAPVPDIRTPDVSASSVFLFWEEFRITAIVLVVGASLGTRRSWKEVQIYLDLIVMNLFVCMGPAVEGYLCWFTITRGVARTIAVFSVTITVCSWFWAMSLW